jgi:hypothetical protein
MAQHDVIDNRHQLLVDEIARMLETSDRARFAVGYLFISGLTPIGEGLTHLKELRLLIGNTTNHKSIDQLAEATRPTTLVANVADMKDFT